MSYRDEPYGTEGYGWKALSKGWKVGVALAIAFLFAVLFWVFCYRQVDAGEIGIITRGGDVDRTEGAGPMVKWPWPIESFHEMEIRVQKETQDAAAASEDLQDVTATLVLNYQLDPEQALDVFSDIGTDYKDRVISPALQEVFKAASAQYTAAELITKRAEVKAAASSELRSRLADYGVIVTDLSLVNFGFSGEFAKSIEETQVANQNALKAEANARKAKAEAQGRLDAALLDAQAQDALQESLTPALLQKWWIEKWDGDMPQITGGATPLVQIPPLGE